MSRGTALLTSTLLLFTFLSGCTSRVADESSLKIVGLHQCTAQNPQKIIENDKTVFTCGIRGGRFHFRFDVVDADICLAQNVKHPLDLAGGDRVEVYFVPDAEMAKGYRCAEIDASGRVLSYSVDKHHNFNWYWKFATLESRAENTRDGYVVEGSVSVDELRSFGIDPKAFYLGVFRAQMSAPEKTATWCSAAPLKLPAHFHQPAMLFPYPARDALAEGFRNPPPEAKPHTWWHWMNGNVTKAGITADLEAIAEAGLGGVQLFDAGCEIPPGPVAFNTPAWDEHVKYAAAEARRLGLEIVVPNCSGWSSSGGPWNPASNSMKRVVFTETPVKAGQTFRGVVEREKTTSVRQQDGRARDEWETTSVRQQDGGVLRQPEDKFGFYEDIAILAVPKVGTAQPLFRSGETRTADMHDAAKNVWTFALDKPYEATALELAVQPAGWIGQHRGFMTVETSNDGQAWTKQDEVVVPLAIDSIVLTDVQRIPFKRAISSRHWRLAFAPQAIPAGVKTGVVSRLGLLNRAVIPGFEGKTFALRDQRPYPANASIGPGIPKGRVVDLTDKVAKDGTLAWTAPANEGDWVLLRIGYASNGRKNHPASRFGCGFECDKLSRSALDYHFEAYIGKLCRELGDLAGDQPSGLVGTLVDSYEIGCCNWTQGFEREFRNRKGYAIRPYLPVLAGYVVGTAEETEKFLNDYRRVIASLFTENYAGAIQRKCREHGLTFSLEPYGNCPADDLEYGYYCDIPMSEFWAGEKNGLGTGNCRIAASIGHVWGRRTIGAEAFTAGPGPISGRWQNDPWRIKAQGDRAYCEGVNRFIFHRFTHQPWGKNSPYLPGMTMGQWGTHFDRTNTWWPYAKGLFRYMTRCQYLLRAGTFVADAAIYLGDKMPSTITPYDTRYVPAGYNCDAINTRGLAALRMRAGCLTAPGGTRYPLIVIPDEPLTERSAIDAVETQRKKGATICRFSEMKQHLPAPDFAYAGTTADVAYIHREYPDGTDGYFVSYPVREKGATLELSFRITGKTPELWDAATGEIVQAAAWREAAGRTTVTWRAAPSGSVFVMFRPGKSSAPLERVARKTTETPVAGPLTLTLPDGTKTTLQEPVSWTELGEAFKYFSGTATYDFTIQVPAGRTQGGRQILDLGTVKNVADVTVNGKHLGVLWKPPFAVDVTESLAGLAEGAEVPVKVAVANLWANRLIGDDFKPEDCSWKPNGGIVEIPDWVKRGEKSPTGRTTFTTWKHWKKTDMPLLSGILGPVRLVCEE